MLRVAALLVFIVLTLSIDSYAQPLESELRQLEGHLEPEDSKLSDGSLYDEYSFEGEEGQSVVISLESDDFNTYLLLVDSAGNKLIENDNWQEGTNSKIEFTLSSTGTYRIWVNAFDETGKGAYQLSIVAVETIREVIFRAAGNLAEGDAVLSDESLYDEYLVEGQAGQSVVINLTSNEFDTYLFLLDSRGQSLAQNNDWNTSTNSTIGYSLPSDGSYRLRINALNESGLGAYEVTFSLSQSNDIVLLESTSDRLNQEGVRLYEQSKYAESIEVFQESLAIRQRISDQRGEGETLSNIGRLYERTEEPLNAIDYYIRAVSIYEETEDRSNEGSLLSKIGIIYFSLNEYSKALSFLERALVIAQEANEKLFEATMLNVIGSIHDELTDYSKALEYYELALSISQEIDDKNSEGIVHNSIGLTYVHLEQYQLALESYERALLIRRTLSDQKGVSQTLLNIGRAYENLEEFESALESYKLALSAVQEAENQPLEAAVTSNIGDIYEKVGDYLAAIEMYQKALDIFQVINNKDGEATTLNNLGFLYYRIGDYLTARGLHEGSLRLSRDLDNQFGIANSLNNLGLIHTVFGEYPQALYLYEQALEISREIDDRDRESTFLNNIGFMYSSFGEYQKALYFYNQALDISRELGDRTGIGDWLNNIGVVYDALGEYSNSLNFYEESLLIRQELGDQRGIAESFNNLGRVYDNLGEYQKSLRLFEKSLEISRKINNRLSEGNVLVNIASARYHSDGYLEALMFFEQALEIFREIGARENESTVLNNIGFLYSENQDYPQALSFFEQALSSSQITGDRTSEGITLSNMGSLYLKLEDYSRALDYFEQSLIVFRATGERAREATTLSNLGSLSQLDNRPALAIVFYKQSVNIYEAIRQDITDQAFLQSYTDTVSGTYRRLADLLLEQGRILEAQQVLELLKIQELQEYTDDERTGETIARTIPTPTGCDLDIPFLKVSLLAAECELISTYSSLVEFGQQFRNCETEQCSNLSDYRRRRNDLFNAYRVAVTDLETFIQERLSTDDALLKPTLFASKAEEIIRQQPGTVIVYPLVLEDNLWLLFAVDGRITSRREIGVSQLELGQTVVKFRELLEDRYSDIDELQSTGKQLYEWLIAPIEQELGANQDIQHLVFSLDRTTRYIPMATLFDGSQYLIEKYTVTTILSAALTNVNERAPIGTENVPILGAGVSEGSAGFSALPNVPIELDGIIQTLDSSTDTQGVYTGRQLLDEQFTFEALQNALAGTQILHIATHGEFISGNRDASYLLMGSGEKLPIPQIETLGTYMENVHLAVLSACQTALGGPDEEGLEIAGLGYYFLKSNVNAVLASLWNVNDSSTSALMQLFYQNLAAGTAEMPVTKAEALQAAQLAMIRSNEPVRSDSVGDGPDRFTQTPRNGSDAPRPESGLAHPYYWAPFTLIGNGL